MAILKAKEDTEAENTDTDVEMVVYSTVREHHEEGRDEKCEIWSLKGLGTSTYSKDIHADEKRARNDEGKHAEVRRSKDGRVQGGTYGVHDARYLACNQSG